MRVVICEDEVLIAEHLRSILIKFGYEVIGLAHTFKDSIRIIDQARPDLAILDIRMDGHSDGIEIGRYISKNYNFPFVFLTASSDKASIDHALAVNPYGYVLKPFESMELYTAIQIAIQKHSSTKDKNNIIIHEGNKDIKIFENQIMWIKSDNIYINIVTNQKTFELRRSLESIESELNEKCFMKCHRSYIVNLNYIDLLHRDSLIIRNTCIPISRQYQKDIREVFTNWQFT